MTEAVIGLALQQMSATTITEVPSCIPTHAHTMTVHQLLHLNNKGRITAEENFSVV